MFDRDIVWVSGPSGAGKTTFIERVLKSNRSRFVAVLRLTENGLVDDPVLVAGGNEETDRWSAAGAHEQALMKVPPSAAADPFDAIFELDDPSLTIADVLLVEGPMPHYRAAIDLSVHVMRPPGSGELMVHERREVDRMDARSFFAGLGIDAEPVEGEVVELDEEEDDDAEILHEFTEEESALLSRLFDEGLPIHQEKHWLTPPFEPLARTHMMVLNGFDPVELAQAERLAAEIRELRRNRDLVRELFMPFGKPPRWVEAVSLADPRDTSTRKLIAALKRQLNRAS